MSEFETAGNYPAHELIVNRWSPVVFSDRQVEREKLRSLFEGARWAPSSMNEQPWSFLVATKKTPGEFDRMVECLTEGNALWAQNAPVLILVVTRTQFEHTGRENRHAWHDAGLATQNLLTQATAAGLHTHVMGGFSRSRALELFEIPHGYDTVSMIAVGYLGDPEDTPEGVGERSRAGRTRRPLTESVFTGKWGEPSALI